MSYEEDRRRAAMVLCVETVFRLARSRMYVGVVTLKLRRCVFCSFCGLQDDLSVALRPVCSFDVCFAALRGGLYMSRRSRGDGHGRRAGDTGAPAIELHDGATMGELQFRSAAGAEYDFLVFD